jgi:hypothetical protein
MINTYIATAHIEKRMAQRSFTPLMISVILDIGEWNDRGDQLIVGKRQNNEINAIIKEKRRMRKKLDQELKALKRLHRNVSSTVVTKDGHLITVYKNAR